MSRSPAPSRVAAIVPAYNEAATLADVVSVLLECSRIDEVIVASDGSTDATVEIARRLGAKAIDLGENRGKAAAMAAGVAATRAPIIVFVDGDILRLTPGMLETLMRPLLDGRAAMSVGTRSRGRLVDAIHRRTGPLLSGIRCLRREVFEAVPEEFVVGYCIETALNWACRTMVQPIETVVLHGLRHRVKEQKRGLWRGAWARLAMFRSVFWAWARLRWSHPDLRSAAAGPWTPQVARSTDGAVDRVPG